mgnify:FL=1
MPTLTQGSPVRVDPSPAIEAPRSADPASWGRYYEELYHDAAEDPARVPWAHLRPCPFLQTWLNTEAPSLLRPGATACVVGSGT